eukprot:3941784-Rhodomonas_salina.1
MAERRAVDIARRPLGSMVSLRPLAISERISEACGTGTRLAVYQQRKREDLRGSPVKGSPRISAMCGRRWWGVCGAEQQRSPRGSPRPGGHAVWRVGAL